MSACEKGCRWEIAMSLDENQLFWGLKMEGPFQVRHTKKHILDPTRHIYNSPRNLTHGRTHESFTDPEKKTLSVSIIARSI